MKPSPKYCATSAIRLVTPSALALLLSSLVVVHRSAGEGFRNPPPGTFNLGRAGGRIAHVDDASAVHQNPANLVELINPEAQLSPTIVYIRANYEAPGGAKAETEKPWKVLPNLFATIPLKEDKLAAGLGITVPYGLSVSWERDRSSPFRYTAPHFTELKTINFNPTLAARLHDTLTVGVGLDVMWSQLGLRQYYPWAIFPGSVGTEPDGKAKLLGDGVGYGANIGITWQPAEQHRFAATYRSPMTVSYDGHLRLSGITPTAAFLGATSSSEFDTTVKFPAIVAVGYGYQVSKNIRVEVDVEWIQFSRFEELNLKVGNNAFLFPSTRIAQDWKDTYTAGIGGDWRFSPQWVLRGGYQFYESPVPDHTFSPTIPDSNQHVFTVGLGYTQQQHSFEFAYGADFYDDRNVTNADNPAFNGKYDFTVHLFSLAYRYAF